MLETMHLSRPVPRLGHGGFVPGCRTGSVAACDRETPIRTPTGTAMSTQPGPRSLRQFQSVFTY